MYQNIFLCPLNKNDCVNSIDIFDDIILYGTLMGNVYLCRANKNKLYLNKKQDIYNNSNQTDNSKVSNRNETQYEIKLKYKIEEKEKESSKISCIKLNTNNNDNQNNGNETLRTNNEKKNEKIIYDSDEIIGPKNGNYNYKSQEISTKQKIWNAIETKNNKNNISMIDGDSIEKNFDDTIIPFPQVTQLILNATENVPCVSFDTKDKVNISIGDYEIIRLENMSTFNINDDNSNYNYCRIRNYPSENDHITNCENATCMMTDKNFLILYTIFGENTSPITKNKVNYENKVMETFDIIKGEIEMYNYSVPFDFDGDRILFLDYESDIIRRICIYYTITKKEPYIYKIDNNFGHINYMKFLLKNRIILCKNQKYCEIHKIDKNFKLINEWRHNGDEIIAMNVYIAGTKDTEENSDNSVTYLSLNNKRNDSQTFEIKTKKKNNQKSKKNSDNIYTMNLRNNNLKRKHYIKDKIFNSTSRELNSKKKELEIDDKYQEYFYNSEISNRNNIFENEYSVEIYNKYNTPTNKYDNKKSLDELSKKKLNKIIYKSINKNYFQLSENEQKNKDKKKNKSLSHYVENINNPTERSLYENEKKIYIVTVDLNGNVNLYHNKINKLIFNLYEIDNIDEKYKEKEFFSLGFPYYVTMNNKYFAISTDHGVFVLSNKV
jgi:hypothetical protein